MQILHNHFRQKGGFGEISSAFLPSIDAASPQRLLIRCPVANVTPMVAIPDFGGAGHVFVKDERTRMGVGSFKALGAAYVVAHAAQSEDQNGKTYVTASAGNHGISVAAGSKVFGANAVVYLSHQVPKEFSARLEAHGATVVWAGNDYAESLEAAEAAALKNGWSLLSDTSWENYVDIPRRLMEGYLVAAAEAAKQIPSTPSHILLQAGVGGLACAAAAYFRQVWGDDPNIIVVEPEVAPALYHSIKQGRLATCEGPASIMGRLDCKTPSLIALNGLARDADSFLLISDEEVKEALPVLKNQGLETSASGGAPLAALFHGISGVEPESNVLCFVSEQNV